MMLTLLPARCCQYGAARPLFRKLWHIAGSKQRSVLMAGKDGKMFMTRSFNIMLKTTEQHLIARSDKSVASMTNNKRLCSTFSTIEANYWQTWSVAQPLCDSRATCGSVCQVQSSSQLHCSTVIMSYCELRCIIDREISMSIAGIGISYTAITFIQTTVNKFTKLLCLLLVKNCCKDNW